MAHRNQGRDARTRRPENPFSDEESIETAADLPNFNPASLPSFTDTTPPNPFADREQAGNAGAPVGYPPPAYSANGRQTMASDPSSRQSASVSTLHSSERNRSLGSHRISGQSDPVSAHHYSRSETSSITLPEIEFPRSVRFADSMPPANHPEFNSSDIELQPAVKHAEGERAEGDSDDEGSVASYRSMSSNDTLYDDSDDGFSDDDESSYDSEGPTTPIEELRRGFGDFELPPVGRESMLKPRQRKSRLSWLQTGERGSQRISMHGDGITGSTESLPVSVHDKFERPNRIPRTGTTWVDSINPLKKSTVPALPEERIVSREYNAPWYSKITFQWIAPLMSVGYERKIDMPDIWRVNPNRAADHLNEKAQTSFQRNKESGYKYPLFWALYQSLKREVIFGGACQFSANIFTVVSPYTLRYLINYAAEAYIAKVKHEPAPPIGRGLGLVFGITAMQILQSLGTNHFLYTGMMVGGQSRGILTAFIFDKSLKLSGRAKAGGKALPPPEGNGVQNGENKEQAPNTKKTKKNGKAKGGSSAAGGDGWGNGKILNLMSIDAHRIDNACGMLHMIWTAPVCCVITLILLIVNLGASALAGFAMIFIGTPALTMAVKTLYVRKREINKINDQRVGLTHEIFSAVKFIKFFGWEKAFMDRIMNIRKTETKDIQIYLGLRNVISAVSITLPVFATLASVVTYSLTGHTLAAAEVFSSVALFNSLRMPLNLLPMVIGQAIDAWASLERIQDFLMAEEMQNQDTFNPSAQAAVQIKHATFTWERTPEANAKAKNGKAGMGKGKGQGQFKPEKPKRQSSKLLLHSKFSSKGDLKQPFNRVESMKIDSTPVRPDGTMVRPRLDRSSRNMSQTRQSQRMSQRTSQRISKRMSKRMSRLMEEKKPFQVQDLDFSCRRNELVAVIGGVGSGKSSLLAALAGDMRRTEGNVVWGASKAYCAQSAWIQNTTVRNNILFGNEMKPDWYNQVIDACALRHDIDMLADGDATEIGEKGITFSGGQKQRLNIARAIYHNSDVILMDDPLSAVDAHVGRHIFDNAICGLLRNKCRILATHQLQVLNRCDRIIMMDKGRIQAIDTYSNLMAKNETFAAMMAQMSMEEQEEEEEKADQVPDSLEKKKSNKERPAPGNALKKKATGLMQAEERAQASVPWSLYVSYVRASGTILNAPWVFAFLVLAQGTNIVTSLWLSWWIDGRFGLVKGVNIAIYASLGVAQAIFMYIFATGLSWLGTTSSQRMLHRAMTRVMHAPMSFFDTTPLGRITNRFSKDVDVMDYKLSDAIRLYAITLATINSIFVLVIVYFHYFAIALAILFPIFLFAASYYRASAREVKRIEATLRSNVFARFSESLSGTACIRAYGVQDRFIKSFRESIDDMNSAYFLSFANQRWLSVRLDSIGNTLVLTVGLLVATNQFKVPPSISGLILSYILGIVQMVQYVVRQLADVEAGMNSVERLDYYGKEIEQEAPSHLDPVDPAWPQRGEITFSNVEMRYRAGLPLVLKGLTMHVRGGERIGVVGRTGAGKSTIMTTLFRLNELSGGRITVDGLDIAKIGLQDLRSRMAIIPQDPNLFRGTIRSNLDPFSQHTDLELWSALRQAHMAPPDGDVTNKKPGYVHLDDNVDVDGSNFSLGQRQLMALARALVRGSQIIVCDEATSSVDLETDMKIQKTMQDQFEGKTMLVIAHRLRTIINYDRIAVMDQGRLAEYDTPRNLFLKRGIFKEMCDSNGIHLGELVPYRSSKYFG